MARDPNLGILIQTKHDDDSAFPALRAGARGYLLKGAEEPELIRAVLAAGHAVYGAAVARRIVAFYSGARQRYTAQVFPKLTPRERDVLVLLTTGARNHEIAGRLELSEKTVRNHISALLLRLQVSDRTTAAARARDAGLGRSRLTNRTSRRTRSTAG